MVRAALSCSLSFLHLQSWFFTRTANHLPILMEREGGAQEKEGRAKWLSSVAGQRDNKGEHRCTCLPAPASPLPGSWPPPPRQLTMTASGQTARWGSPLPRHRIWELKDRGKTIPQNWEIRNDHRQRTRGETGHHKTEEAIWQWGENCHCQFSLTPWAFLMGSRKSVSGSRKCLQGTGNSLVMAWWLGMRWKAAAELGEILPVFNPRRWDVETALFPSPSPLAVEPFNSQETQRWRECGGKKKTQIEIGF